MKNDEYDLLGDRNKLINTKSCGNFVDNQQKEIYGNLDLWNIREVLVKLV